MNACPDCSANLDKVELGKPCPACGSLRRDAWIGATPGVATFSTGRVSWKTVRAFPRRHPVLFPVYIAASVLSLGAGFVTGWRGLAVATVLNLIGLATGYWGLTRVEETHRGGAT